MDKQFPDLSVMVIDDEPFMIKMATRMLTQLGVGQIRACESGQQALDDLKDHKMDIAFCDLNMPDMDGLALMRLFRDLDHKPAIVVFSGEDKNVLHTASELGRAHGLNVLGQLPKPIKKDVVIDLLDRYQPSAGRRFGFGATLTPDEIAQGIQDGAVLPVFQPKVMTADRQLYGVETLLRWHQPDGSILGPGAVVPVAEKHGLMADLTRAVVKASLEQAAILRDAGLVLKTAINVSVEDLYDVAFADDVTGMAQDAGIDPKNVVLEVTESRLMEDIAAPLEVLSRLKMRGFVLSIDDFGTGASSLQQLRRIPFSELKIDREFVDKSPEDPEKQAILRSTIDMANALDLTIVAEGVETEAEWNLIAELGCHIVQGYYIAKPMSQEDLLAWAKANQPAP